MTNLEIVTEILEKLEKNHINLYHDVEKEIVEKYIKSIDWISLSEIEFDCQMKKLFALFKDPHTSYFVNGNEVLSDKIRFVQGRFYLCQNNTWIRILKIANLSENEFHTKMKELINYETTEWLNYQINNLVNNAYYFKMLGLIVDDKLKVELENNEKVYLNVVENDMTKKQNSKHLLYSFDVLENDIIYIKYLRCVSDEKNPFETFVEKIKESISNQNITKYILDVRDNVGGNSQILKPLKNFIVKKRMTGVVLMNNGTFSSGTIAVADFKRDCKAVIVGENAGGAVKSYGDIRNLSIGSKRISCSTKYFDFSEYFDCNDSIRPDVFIATSMDDLILGRDVQLAKAIEILNTKDV